MFLICIYGGYFGAAAGVLMLALLLRAGHATLAHANASKNVIAGVANSVAALIFVFVAPVHWPAVVALGLGCLVGSRLGPIVVRHAPAGPLRVAIGAAGLALAIKLGIDAYARRLLNNPRGGGVVDRCVWDQLVGAGSVEGSAGSAGCRVGRGASAETGQCVRVPGRASAGVVPGWDVRGPVPRRVGAGRRCRSM